MDAKAPFTSSWAHGLWLDAAYGLSLTFTRAFVTDLPLAFVGKSFLIGALAEHITIREEQSIRFFPTDVFPRDFHIEHQKAGGGCN